MSKCIRCGNSFLMHRKVKLKDAFLCGKCYKELGFDNYLISESYKWDEIKDGYEAYQERKNREFWEGEAHKKGLTLPHFSALNKIGATDTEVKIMSSIYAILKDEGKDAGLIEISAGDNGSVNLSVDGEIFLSYKADGGVKWISFGDEKIRIGGAGRTNSLAPRIIEAFDKVN